MEKNYYMKKSIVLILIFAIVNSLIPTRFVNASNTKSEEVEEKFNYLYINESEQEVGNEQSIVLSWGNGEENIISIALYVKNENQEEIEIHPVEHKEGVYLYQNVFEKGIYQITKAKIITPGEEEEFNLEELGTRAYFGVGEECADYEKSEHFDMESINTQEIETSIVTIDKNEIETAQDEIVEAFAESAETNGVIRRNKTTDKVVVVLDPGHDSKHLGARGNGIKEELATLEIAKYCKEELENYEGVTVYLTRETAACPYPDSEDNLDDIEKRVMWASEKGADAFVSIHLNAATSSSAKGAEVYYSKSSDSGKELAQKIQDELLEIGLYDRGIKTNEKYTAIKTAKKCGFPGIIVEHAFLSNKNDAEKYLKTTEGLKKLGQLDAAGIAEYFGLKKIGTAVAILERNYEFNNKSVGKGVVGVKEGRNSEYAAIVMNPKEKIASQRFDVVSAGDKYYYIIAEHSGKAITVGNNYTVYQKELSKTSKKQKFMFLTAGEGYYYLRSATGKYLEAVYDEAGNISLFANDYTGEDAQKWKRYRAEYRPIEHLMPELVSAKTSTNAVVVKWKVLTGAQGYYVYRKLEGQKWKQIKKITSADIVSYTDKNPVAGKKNYYTVLAYKEDTISKNDRNGVSVLVSPYVIYKTTTNLYYRTGPGTKYSKKGILKKGKNVKILEGWSKEANGQKWSKISIHGKHYYIASKFLKKI